MTLAMDITRFKAHCKETRRFIGHTIQTGAWTAEEFSALPYSEKKDWYEFERGEFLAERRAPTKTLDDLRSELSVAAGTAMGYGATKSQIDAILSLAEKTGNMHILSGGRLTKTEASRIIDVMTQ